MASTPTTHTAFPNQTRYLLRLQNTSLVPSVLWRTLRTIFYLYTATIGHYYYTLAYYHVDTDHPLHPTLTTPTTFPFFPLFRVVASSPRPACELQPPPTSPYTFASSVCNLRRHPAMQDIDGQLFAIPLANIFHLRLRAHLTSEIRHATYNLCLPVSFPYFIPSSGTFSVICSPLSQSVLTGR